MGYLLTFWEKKGNFYIVALTGRLWVYIVAAQVAVLYMCGADSRRKQILAAQATASRRQPQSTKHKKPLSMTGKTVRLRGFRAYIKALSFLSIVLLLKSSFVFGEDCIFDFVPRF